MIMKKNPWIPLTREPTSDSGAVEARAGFPSDSKWLDGHFPDNPVAPGVALLALILEVAGRELEKENRPVFGFTLKKIKFKQIVSPDQELSVRLTRGQADSGSEFSFDISRNGSSVCSGVIILEHNSD
mgnify:CR=1 FL=1